MSRPIIGITVGEVHNKNLPWAPLIYGQYHTYTDAVLRAGGVPVLLPIVGDELALRELYKRLDGLLLSGGNDVDPAHYNEVKKEYTGTLSPARDTQELQLVSWALADAKPVLGICRGMQLLNVALGGSLYQDISAEVSAIHNHDLSEEKQDYEYIAHERLIIEPGSTLANILGLTTIKTNALHHQGVKILGEGLKAVAWADDDIIEAVELETAEFVLGVQSHPEALEAEVMPTWRKLFEAFVLAATV